MIIIPRLAREAIELIRARRFGDLEPRHHLALVIHCDDLQATLALFSTEAQKLAAEERASGVRVAKGQALLDVLHPPVAFQQIAGSPSTSQLTVATDAAKV